MRDENDYEDLLADWSDLESGLGIILGNPDSSQQFVPRVLQYDRWMQGLMLRDPDVGLYLLFQLATNSPVGYSASHALVCAVLCHIMAQELSLPKAERDSLVRAALTMNVAMTALQDILATQVEKPSPLQQEAIRAHPVKGAMLLGNLGVTDDNWIEVVSIHHDDAEGAAPAATSGSAARLSHILRVVDRYAAMISPRLSHAGRSAAESARSITASNSAQPDDVGHTLVRAVGLSPPGTYVRLDSDELAVVVRRSDKPNMPFVAIVGKPGGEILHIPRLHPTASSYPRIKGGLPPNAVRTPLNHYLILQLGTQSAAIN